MEAIFMVVGHAKHDHNAVDVNHEFDDARMRLLGPKVSKEAGVCDK